jgi:hypothetical protein
MLLKKWQKRWERCLSAEWVMVASRPKVSFYQMAATVPDIRDGEYISQNNKIIASHGM